jgi:hypothetical protein
MSMQAEADQEKASQEPEADPMADSMTKMAEHFANMQSMHSEAIMTALERMQANMSRPKRVVRDKSGRVSHVETV